MGREAVVAVVDADDSQVAVWWVNVGPRPVGQRAKKMSRLCGAWTIGPTDAVTLESLTFKRMVLATAAGYQALDAVDVAVERPFDVSGSVALVNADLDRHREAFEVEQASRVTSKQLQTPDWPVFLSPIDVENPPQTTPTDSSAVGRVFQIAHWLAQLCSQWEGFEEQRLASSWLSTLEGPGVRETPIAIADAHRRHPVNVHEH